MPEIAYGCHADRCARMADLQTWRGAVAEKLIDRGDGKERERALDLAIAQIEKLYGKGSIMRMGSSGALLPVAAISTGSLELDAALGVGGVPRGRIIEIFGPESSGKTTLALHIIAEAQRAGGSAAFVDAEHALDAGYARSLGVKIDDVLISQPDTGEQALEITEVLVRSGAVDAVVIDSVAALVPRAEIDGEMGEPTMGLQARLMSQALRKLTAAISKSKTCVIFINQLREKIGVMFGNPETTTGGRALKFYSSIRLDIRRISSIKEGDNIVGSRVKVKVVKNKVAPPFQTAEFEILYNQGINLPGDLLECGVKYGVLQKAGASYSYGETKLGVGREAASTFLRESPKVAKDIREAAWKAAKAASQAGHSAPAPAAE